MEDQLTLYISMEMCAVRRKAIEQIYFLRTKDISKLKRTVDMKTDSGYINDSGMRAEEGLSTMGEDNEAELSLLHDLHIHCATTLKDDLSFLIPICRFSPFLKLVRL